MRHFFLAVVMVVMAALGARAFTVDGVTYSTSGGIATVTGASSKSITRLTIPATVTYGGTTYPVNFIAGNAFWGYSSLRELVIEDCDTYIGSWHYNAQFGDPFKGCPIEKAYVGRNLALKVSGGYQDYLTPISSSALMDLTIAGKATFVTTGMDNGLTFMKNTSVRTLTIGGSVAQVHSYAFNGCTNLRKVTILPGTEPIIFEKDNIFTGCPIDSLIVGRDISSSNRCGDAQMHTVIITADVNNLSNSIFENCTSVKQVVLNDSKETLSTSEAYNYMFRGCVLDSVYIGRPYSVSPMFGGAQVKKVIYGPMMDKIEKTSFLNHSELEEVVFSDNITEIGEMAFNGCSSLTEVRLPESLRIIERNAFNNCTSLAVADLTPNIETIGSGAFYSTALTSVCIPKSVRAIDGTAFERLNLKSFILEDGDTEIEPAFSYTWPVCRNGSIDSVYIGRPVKDTGSGSMLSRFFESSSVAIKKIEFGPVYTEIPDFTCSSYKNLESVVLPESCTKIGDRAFSNCTSLTEVKFPESLKTIGSGAFEYCNSLVCADLTPNIETIGSSAFRSTALNSVYIPKSVKAIDGQAYCSLSLESFIIEKGDTELTLGVDQKMYEVCYMGSIDSVYVGRALVNSSLLFGSCHVKKIEIGSTVTEIETLLGGNSNNCRNALEYVGLPATLEKLGYSVFGGCGNIDSIHIAAKIPPVCESTSLFDSQVYTNAILTVPVGSKKAYRAAEVWKLFRNIQSEGGGFKVSVSADTAYGEVLLNGSSASEITVDEDESLTVAISPVEGYSISNVTVNGTDVTASLVDGTLEYESLDSNMEIEVTFSIITFTLSVPAELTGGHILVNGLDAVPATVDYGSRLEISAVPDRGYLLTSMTVGGVDVTASLDESLVYVIDRVTADVVVDAAFEPIVYTVTAVAPTDFGTLTLNGATGNCRVAFGQPLVIGVTPAHEGCYLASLTVDGTDVTASVKDGVYTVESVEADMTVEAVFGINTYTVELVCDPERGAIIPDLPGSDAGVTVTHGATLNLAITPAEGFEIESVLLDGTDVTSHLRDNGVLTLEYVKGPHRVEAVFAVRLLRLSVIGLEGGQLSMRYDYGSSVTMLVEPADGWMFHSLTVGDEVVTVLDDDDSYTIPSLTDDTTVSVVFKLDQGSAGVDELTRNITVSARQRTVTVTGASEGETVEIYDTSGMCVYRGTDHVIDLNRQGVFIVRVASLSFKVMLK